MSELYVVKRPFHSNGSFFAVGTLIEDLATEVRRGKIKITEGKIARVPEEGPERDRLITWFQVRKGIDLAKILEERVSKGSEVAEPEEQAANTPPPGTTEPSTKTEAKASKPASPTNKPNTAPKSTTTANK